MTDILEIKTKKTRMTKQQQNEKYYLKNKLKFKVLYLLNKYEGTIDENIIKSVKDIKDDAVAYKFLFSLISEKKLNNKLNI